MELKKEKERVTALTRNYDMEIHHLVNEKDHILADLTMVNDERNLINRELKDLAVIYEGERGRNALVVNGLQGEIGKKNMELAS